MTDEPIAHPSSPVRPPAANQPSHAADEASGRPEPTGSGPRSTGDSGDEPPDDAPVGGATRVPGDPAGVSVPSPHAAPGTSETAEAVDDMTQLTEDDND